MPSHDGQSTLLEPRRSPTPLLRWLDHNLARVGLNRTPAARPRPGHTALPKSAGSGEDYVRDVIHAFNERGFDALDPKWSGDAPRKAISDQVRERICLIARTSPADWGITAFSTWGLSKLADHLVRRKVTAAISRETLRRTLRASNVSWQSTTTWKASTDPDFLAKMPRVLELYDTPPADGRVVYVDEFGPLNLQPHKGKAWQPQGRPRLLRATYHRSGGVMHMLAAPPWTWPPGRSTTASASGSGGASSSTCSKPCVPTGPGRSCTWCWTTSPRTSTPECAPEPRPTASSWCSYPPAAPG
jgi:transposase